MNRKINLALQVIPSSESKHPYEIVDAAIQYIRSTGIKYEVCPFETVMEGEYDVIMDIVKQVQLVCFEAGASDLIVNIKIQNRAGSDVTIEEKMNKYR